MQTYALTILMVHESMAEATRDLIENYLTVGDIDEQDAPEDTSGDEDGPVEWRMPEFSPDEAMRVLEEMGGSGSFTLKDIEK